MAVSDNGQPDKMGESRLETPPESEAELVDIASQASSAFPPSSSAEPPVDGSGLIVEPPAPGQRPMRRVLVVDDDPVIRMLLGMGLEHYGYECVTAEHGKAAQAILQRDSFDLLVVDLLMPVMDGLAFIRWLRKTAMDTTPVLVFTNVDDLKIAREAVACGANALAGKPMPLRELVAAMNTLIPVETV
jgi:CheY-like chemotaxis protein